MPSPVLNESSIMLALDRKVAVETVDTLRLGSLLALIDAHDRKLLRDNFVELSQAAHNLAHLSGRLHAYQFVQDRMKAGDYDSAKMDDLIIGLTAASEAQRHKLFTLMGDVVQCPYDGDSKH